MLCIRTLNGSLITDIKAIRINPKSVPQVNDDLTVTDVIKFEISIEYGNNGKVSNAGSYSNLRKAEEQLNRIYNAIKDDRKVVSLSKE